MKTRRTPAGRTVHRSAELQVLGSSDQLRDAGFEGVGQRRQLLYGVDLALVRGVPVVYWPRRRRSQSNRRLIRAGGSGGFFVIDYPVVVYVSACRASREVECGLSARIGKDRRPHWLMVGNSGVLGGYQRARYRSRKRATSSRT